jgi:hypothetical protein
MHVITLEGSNHQKSRLRNGHKVRVKHGSGFNVIVNPTTYHLVSRAFNRGKGTTLQLSPEEIEMNRAPSPELQRQIMGHNNHLILPTGPNGELIKGSGIGDWFKNLGNTIKSGFEDKIINPAKDLVNKYIPGDVQRDIKSGLKFASPVGLATDVVRRLAKGDKIGDIANEYKDDFMHLNNTKNRIIKSSPVLTEAYKKGVPALAGVATGALGSAFGLSPATGALLGAAGAKGANELLKAEGYGLYHHHPHHHHHHPHHHHALLLGEHHHYHELKHHHRPIGGALGWHHIKNFFRHAGHAIHKATPAIKQGAQMTHHFILKNPELAKKIKEHGSKLAGALAKMGANYLTGDEKYGEMAENFGSKLADEQIHQNLGYGLVAGAPPSSGNGLGTGLYAGKMRGTGPFHSYHTLHDSSNANAEANAELAGMSKHIIHNQHRQHPIPKYYEGDNAPPSRGTGIHPHNAHHIHQNNHLHQRIHVKHPHDHHNLIRGRGALIEHDTELPQALSSQPYGANFHMQFQLPPQYQKYNDGTYTF